MEIIDYHCIVKLLLAIDLLQNIKQNKKETRAHNAPYTRHVVRAQKRRNAIYNNIHTVRIYIYYLNYS